MSFCYPSRLLLLLLLPVLFFRPCHSQQPYSNNAQLDCYAPEGSTALGYSCDGGQSSCYSLLTYRAKSPYLSTDLIAYLLSSDSAAVHRLNAAPLAADDLVLIPVSCSCSNQFYQHNTSYMLKNSSETYFTVANDTFGGLSTCQALIDRNPYDSRLLSAGDTLFVPLRCACPTLIQTRAGVKNLLSYVITWGDDVPTIAETFGADYQAILTANELHENSTIYPFTTLLVPIFDLAALSTPRDPAPKVYNVPPPPSTEGTISMTALQDKLSDQDVSPEIERLLRRFLPMHQKPIKKKNPIKGSP